VVKKLKELGAMGDVKQMSKRLSWVEEWFLSCCNCDKTNNAQLNPSPPTANVRAGFIQNYTSHVTFTPSHQRANNIIPLRDSMG
jgi:hypothetical protein